MSSIPETTTTNLMSVIEFKRLIDGELAKVFAEQIELAEGIDPLYKQLLEEMSVYIARGGKRLRPYLAYLSYLGFGGSDPADIYPVAVAQELIHSFGLMQDDIMDRDIIRHGGPNISGRYQTIFGSWAKGEAEHLAEAMAMLASDINIVTAFELIATSQFNSAIRQRMLSRTKAMVFEAVGGQQLDVVMPWLPSNEVTVERLLRVCQYKTSSYSFEAPLQIGAIAACALDSQIKSIAAVGQPLGIAFQLGDDLLGVFGNEDETGKSVLSDLREGKRTLLVQYALEEAPVREADRLRGYLGNPKVGYHHLADVRAILEQSGARDRVASQAELAAAEAKRAITKVGWSNEVAAALTELADFITNRKA